MDNYQIMKEILQTNRLILREYTQEDFNDLLSILSDPETMKYYPKPYDEKGCQREISIYHALAGDTNN